MLELSIHTDTQGSIPDLLKGEVVSFRLPGLMNVRINYLSGFLYRLMSELDQGYLSELVLVLLKEITSNCSKAHAKRIFFKENGFDITDPLEYKKRIGGFGSYVLEDWEPFLAQHENNEYYIDVRFKKESDCLLISVENNTEILPIEWDRIQKRRKSFQKFKNIDSAFSEIRDESEGAGLGIVLSLILLQNGGISPDMLKVGSKNGSTVHVLKIPAKIAAPELQNKIKQRILNEVKELPSFPEHIQKIVDLCNSDTASMTIVAGAIQKDPALTAQILRLVNSAEFITRKRNPGLEDAVKILGMETVGNLVLATGARTVISSRYKYRELESIWEGSNQVFAIARNLARGKPEISETASTAGLLYELGKIVLLSVNPELVKEIDRMLGNGRIRSSYLMEEIALGISHPEIGALLAERWNFPSDLITALRFQQKPLQVPDEYREIVHVVYLSIRIFQYSRKLIEFYAIEPEILAKFDIFGENSFNDLARRTLPE